MTKEDSARLQELAAQMKPALDDEESARTMLDNAVQRQQAIFAEMKKIAGDERLVVTADDVAFILKSGSVEVAPNVVSDDVKVDAIK